MKPTIGRIVFYQRHGSPNGQHKAEPSPAVITAVSQDGEHVDLCVLNPSGIYFDRNTCHDPKDDPKVETDGTWTAGTWRWPPRVA